MAEFNDRRRGYRLLEKDESTIAAAFVLVQNHRAIPPLQSQNWNSQHLERVFLFGDSALTSQDLPFGSDVRAGVTKQPWVTCGLAGYCRFGKP